MGGALAEEPPMPKLEFREKECLENFGIFAKVLELAFWWEWEYIYRDRRWLGFLGLISQFIWLLNIKWMFWWFLNLLGNKKEEMVKKVEKSDGLGFEMGIAGHVVF